MVAALARPRRETTSRGVTLRRARIVSEPVTEYIRYEHSFTFTNVAAGEQVRWLPRRQASDIALPGNDYWLFDDQLVQWNHFTGDGASSGPEITEDPAAAKLCQDAFAAVWDRAIPARPVPDPVAQEHRSAHAHLPVVVRPGRPRGRAKRLRDLRKGAGLTIVELAGRCGWTHSKSSRIENARTAPSAKDIRAWCAATAADDQATTSSRSPCTPSRCTRMAAPSPRRPAALQHSSPKLFQDTSLFRVYSSSLVPGLLQTEGYAAAILRTSARFRQLPVDDSDVAASGTVERSRIIYEAGRRFVLVVEEGVLHHQMGDTTPWPGSWASCSPPAPPRRVRWESSPRRPPTASQWPRETFHMYDDRLVSVELVSAQVRISQPTEVALYVSAFEQLRSMAVYGADARTLIVRAIEALR
jgi:transcriptional regulator with XRE-family HTH domain